MLQQHDVSVSLKLVQVRVLDKSGNPVPGLTASDFELRDNGKAQKITGFEAYFEEPQAVPAKPEPEAAPPDAPPLKPPPKNLPAPEKFILLFDEENNDLSGLQKARVLAARILKTQVRPRDEVAVLTWSVLNGLKVRLNPTADLKNAGEVISTMPLFPVRDVDETFTVVGEGSVFARGYAESPAEMKIKSVHFSRRMADLARFLSTLPGRKNLILFSWGMPRSLFPKSGLREEVEDMGREMATADTPLITINTERPKTGTVTPNEFDKSGGDSVR
ncbi:MAG: hypothetical protein A2Y69_01085 [Candidatus Aminicenantes bacterium RBG_13_59_9]|nr:MAG: hypothetical protein A2Y69_01085 [Candidatus Aminicenantes bacterium RBG_13_59_9]